jgi:hypothetical protein
MPTINMMPRIETTLVRGHPGAGPYGPKGAGRNRLRPTDGSDRERDP